MSTNQLPSHAQVVIIGGGIIGCSLAYHLTKLNMSDVLLLERKTLTSGTTWHAAGLVGQLRATQNMTRLAQYTSNLLANLEAETGQPTGFLQNGSISIANNRERFEELKRGASMARVFGLEVDVITPQEAADAWPLMNASDLVGAVWLPKDGRTNPVDTTRAFAKGAEQHGAQIVENVKVTGIHQVNGRVTGVCVVPDGGEGVEIQCEIVANCAGMWAREIGKWAGVNIPLHAAEHFYVISEPIEGVSRNLPTLRDPGGYTYYREEVGAILAGFFEPNAKPWGMKGIPADFEFGTLPEDWEHLDPVFDVVAHRMPIFETAGIHTFFNGPESFTPDDAYHLGEAPELKNFYVATGFNSIGIQSSGGAGKVLAEWIVNGHPPMDLWDVDIRRNMPFQGNHRYLFDRTTEGLGLLYDMHWPFKQFKTGRDVRKSTLHDRLAAHGACFGTAAGWERPNWFAPEGVEPVYKYSYGRQNWFEYSAQEHKAVRENVGIFDQSSFAKYLIQGRDTLQLLNRICGGQIDVPIGKVVYTQMLNERGGIEADVTVNRIGDDQFLVLDAAASQNRTFSWINRQIQPDEFVIATDVTSGYCMLSVMGPNSRALLHELTDADLSNQAFPFGTSQEIDVAYARARATRMTYVGELGWELLVPTEFAQGVYDAITDVGRDFDLMNAGYHAMNSLRQEKGYRHWGHDITDEDTPVEAGLRFAVKFEKERFNGRERLLQQKTDGVNKRLVQFALEDENYLLYHNEPVWRDNEMVGHITSAMFGHTIGAAVGMGYIHRPELITADFVKAGHYEIEVATVRVPARASLQPLYDPKSKRVKS
ncbi:FAD-dependent oxidoreductase [Chloroflexi bacterium TSY]|nr:FAD-dependent oxidoreductase [Chloroflexi bacterium TSY]